MNGVDLIYKDECYELVGCAYAVYNSLKYGHYELFYQRAYADELTKKCFSFEREHKVRVTHKGKKVGSYSLDFLVENKIVVELKVADDFYPMHIKQVLTYLKATNKKLGIIILITPDGIRYKRLVN
ncbi:MAG TPA: GxxExxY protein [Candidatus Magasanikbacteria bacterium]|nr:GxxExxY protein [Candidatus Magasanikbacteria bacterium]